MEKITERESLHRHLEKKSVRELLEGINQEDQKVALAVKDAIWQIEPLVKAIVTKMEEGGRLFYIGAGTSGRLGVLDASECPPTFGVPPDWVVGIMAGGDIALRNSVEHAEDDTNQAIIDLKKHYVSDQDVVVGIASSGTTPYVVHGLKDCQELGIITGCITCNPGSPILDHATFQVLSPVGPEYVTGSTRMKSGTSQKLILNMISTSVMIMLGRVKDNRMVDMALSNSKLKDRGAKMLMHQSNLTYKEAEEWLLRYGSVRKAAANLGKGSKM